MRDIRITFSLDAYEWWERTIDLIADVGVFFVRISPPAGGAPFDAMLYGRDPNGEVANTVIVRRTDADGLALPGAERESIVADKIHIY
jgi:hypothetical protein